MQKPLVIHLALLLTLVIAASLFARDGDLNSFTQDAHGTSTLAGDTIQIGNIEWLVLAIDGDKAFILSKRVLGHMAFHLPGGSITWENCTLREYLNNSFYNSTFNEQEKARIIETEVVNHPNRRTSGGNNTKDKVFLLSIDEVNEYMGNNAHDNLKNAKLTNTWWWLRSPGSLGGGAAAKISTRASLQAYYVSASGGVRPALWINL